MPAEYNRLFCDQLDDLAALLERMKPLAGAVSAAGEALTETLRRGNKLLTAGNGGSAADALHLAEELIGRFDRERPPLAAVSLCGDPTLLTCIGNDYGFDMLFSRQVEGLGKPGDALIVISTSGNSRNLVNALNVANQGGLITLALLGKTGGAAKGLARHEIIVPDHSTARIQEVHTFILHAWLRQIEAGLFPTG